MLKAKGNNINEQGKVKKPANEMSEQGNEHVDHQRQYANP
jgi:hypothetical protein